MIKYLVNENDQKFFYIAKQDHLTGPFQDSTNIMALQRHYEEKGAN